MNNSIGYTGTVTVKTLYKDKVIREKVYHNTGCLPLFEYLAYCLSGNASTHANNVPTYLRLWRLTNPSAVPFTSSDVMEQKTYNAIPWSDVSVVTDSSAPSASVSYTFLVSGANVDPSGDPVNVIAIYDVVHSSALMLPSAWVQLDSEEELQGSTNASGVSYLIIWTMTVANQAQQ